MYYILGIILVVFFIALFSSGKKKHRITSDEISENLRNRQNRTFGKFYD